MAYVPKILAMAGSTREASFNKKLVRIAVSGARSAGAEVTIVELRDLGLPLYDGDLETRDGLPPAVRKLKDLMLAHQGFMISSPEYNSSISAVLKNAIDWASRPVPGEAPLECFTGKTAAIMSASPGARRIARPGSRPLDLGEHQRAGDSGPNRRDARRYGVRRRRQAEGRSSARPRQALGAKLARTLVKLNG